MSTLVYKTISRIVTTTLFLSLFLFSNSVMAEGTAETIPFGSVINYSLLGVVAAIILFYGIYVLRSAFAVISDNGESVESEITLFRNMANKGKLVTILLLLIVLIGIYWVVTYSA